MIQLKEYKHNLNDNNTNNNKVSKYFQKQFNSFHQVTKKKLSVWRESRYPVILFHVYTIFFQGLLVNTERPQTSEFF